LAAKAGGKRRNQTNRWSGKMGIRMPGSMSGLVDPKMVEQLIEIEKIPIETAKKRRDKVVSEKDEVQKVQKMIGELNTSLNAVKTKGDFYKMKVESSHPDIIDGTVKGNALTGSYEFEVRSLAKKEKELAYGFPDKDQTAVGFGWMLIEREGEEDLEIVVEPGSTLQDVANAINEKDAGLKAMIVNTKYQPEPYRLLVMGEKSGKESKILIDEDTTFLEFKEQVTGRDLDVLFEDVPVSDNDNDLDELIDGVVFHVKRSEPGTRVQVNIVNDVEATYTSIKNFVDKYNDVMNYLNSQFKLDPQTNKAGVLAADGSLKSIQRALQGALGFSIKGSKKFSTLAEIGMTTDPKTGAININESKVKASLAEDYDSVASLFIRTNHSVGIGEQMAEKIKAMQDSQTGLLKSRIRGLESVIKNQDQEIERKERNSEKREEEIRRRFTALEGQLATLKNQGSFLAAKLGGAPAEKGD
jgi:flagellar hook-associated protein 2